MAELLITENRAELVTLSVDWIVREVRSALAERGEVSIALAGGSTPQPIHAGLAEVELPWEQLTFFFGDERCVPPDDPQSNFGLAASSLFDRLEGTGPRIVRMEGEDPDREGAARRYAERLPARLDILVLGIGEDGHTASLFPGAESLEEIERRVLFVTGPKPPCERLTITPPVIRSARRLLMLDAGAEKAAATRRALEGDESAREVPARLARHGTWILDRAAAAELTEPSPTPERHD